MASANTKISFTCPNCDKVLRTSVRPPQGKKVKCPECGEAFVPNLDDEDEATGIQEKPSLKGKSAPKRDDDDPDEKPRGKKSRDEDDEEDDGPPKKKRRPDDDDEDEADRSIKKKKKSGSSMMLWIGLGVVGGGGALLSCVLCGVGAFVWPGFLSSKNGNLAAFVPPDANIVMGGNPKLMRNKAPKLEKFIREQAAFAQPANKQNDMEDVSFNSDRMLAFGNTKNIDGKMVILFQSTAADVAKLKRNPNLGPAQVVGGHANVHKATEEGKRNGIPSFIAFPGNNIVIGAELDEKGLIALLERGKKAAQPNAALDLSRNVDSSPFWAAVSFDADTKRNFRQGLEKGGVMLPAALANATPAIDGVKGLTFAIDITDKEDIKMEANVICKNADDAGKIKAGAQAGVDTLKQKIDELKRQPFLAAMLPPTLVEDLKSITLSTKDATATASMKIASQTIQDLAALGAKQRNFPIGGAPVDFPKGGGNPPPLLPPPQNFPNLMAPNLAAGQTREGTYNFQQGMNANFHIHAASDQGAIVELTVLQGAAGEKVVFTDNQKGQVRISNNYMIPATGVYRVRLRNLGPGVVPNGNVFVFAN